MKDTGAERRNFARERTQIEVEISKDFKHTKGVMEYLSFGGAFISLSRPFVKDCILQIKFDLPGEYAAFQATAKVVWVRKDQAMGVQFIDIPETERLKLERLLTAI